MTDLKTLERRIETLIPEDYRATYETLQPVSMGSAGLKYDADGRVAWSEIWQSFCDLAMAGGPPHKGTLLQAATWTEVSTQAERHAEVVAEIRRGITLATELEARVSPIPGWVRVHCLSEVMAGWLLRAIVMENVAAHAEGAMLDLPAAPHFRVEKEIKNVVTVIAKTCHYWMGHVPPAQKQEMARLIAEMDAESALVQPALASDPQRLANQAAAAGRMAEAIHASTGLVRSSLDYPGWLGLECASAARAVWMMRGLLACNVLARREGTSIFVAVNPAADANGARTAALVARVHGLAGGRGA